MHCHLRGILSPYLADKRIGLIRLGAVREWGLCERGGCARVGAVRWSTQRKEAEFRQGKVVRARLCSRRWFKQSNPREWQTA